MYVIARECSNPLRISTSSSVLVIKTKKHVVSNQVVDLLDQPVTKASDISFPSESRNSKSTSSNGSDAQSLGV